MMHRVSASAQTCWMFREERGAMTCRRGTCTSVMDKISLSKDDRCLTHCIKITRQCIKTMHHFIKDSISGVNHGTGLTSESQ